MRNLCVVLFVMLFSVTGVYADKPSESLINALLVAEGNDDYAVGDETLADKAYGCLQIRQPAVDDYNSWYGTNYRAEDCLGNRELSFKICYAYIDRYATEQRLGRKPTDKDKARIWNGGPVGCFDNGALDKNGRTHKSSKRKEDVARQQRRAQKYWEERVLPNLK